MQRLVEDWQRRIRSYLERIERDPEGSWIWKIRAKILNYLIFRYGNEPLQDVGSGRAFYGGADSLPAASAPEAGRPPKGRATIRVILEKIQKSAAERPRR